MIKVDNGKPFGDPQGASVPEVDLWLIGLGIEVVWNRPRCPRDNAKVERMQYVTAMWSELDRCRDEQQLQSRLDQVALIQREQYAVRRLGGESRKQHYAELWNNQRAFVVPEGFSIQKVHQYLSQVVFVRKVNKGGFLSFYAQKVYVGTAYSSKTMIIRFNPKNKTWQLTNHNNHTFAFFPADNFSEQNILNLTVCQKQILKCKKI